MKNINDWKSQSLPPYSSPHVDSQKFSEHLARSRSWSAGFLRPRKSILKVKTHQDSLTSSWGTSNQVPKNVDWMEVHIRQYERTIGDNPSCSSGPPLSIGWEFDPRAQFMTIDGFESLRPLRRRQAEMVVAREEREYLLLIEWQVPQHEISNAIRRGMKTKHERRQTVMNLRNSTALEEVMESAGRKLIRAVSFQNRSSAQVAQLMEKHLAAEAQREDIWDRLINREEHDRYDKARTDGSQQRPSAQMADRANHHMAAPAQREDVFAQQSQIEHNLHDSAGMDGSQYSGHLAGIGIQCMGVEAQSGGVRDDHGREEHADNDLGFMEENGEGTDRVADMTSPESKLSKKSDKKIKKKKSTSQR